MTDFVKTRFLPCPRCKSRKGPLEQPGFHYVEGGYVEECECHKKWREQNITVARALKSNIWGYEEFLSYNPLKDYTGTVSVASMKKLVAFVRAYDEDASLHSICLYLTGFSGSQKTTLAQWVGLSLLKKGYTVQNLTMSKLMKGFERVSFSETPEQKAHRENNENKLVGADLLILDNSFDRARVSGVAYGSYTPALETFLRKRIEEERKGVLFVSSCAPTDILKEGFTKSLQEFIVNNTIKKGTCLTFNDVYNSYEVSDIFKDAN